LGLTSFADNLPGWQAFNFSLAALAICIKFVFKGFRDGLDKKNLL
jgi:hypothetical protein